LSHKFRVVPCRIAPSLPYRAAPASHDAAVNCSLIYKTRGPRAKPGCGACRQTPSRLRVRPYSPFRFTLLPAVTQIATPRAAFSAGMRTIVIMSIIG
jgi:hypothetical protein